MEVEVEAEAEAEGEGEGEGCLDVCFVSCASPEIEVVEGEELEEEEEEEEASRAILISARSVLKPGGMRSGRGWANVCGMRQARELGR